MAELIKYLSLEGLKTYDDKIKEYIGNLLDAANGDITAVEALVNTLVSEDSGKSVRTIANEELAAQLIPENAKEALDTLQEIAAWIQKHPDDVAAMNAAINANTAAIGAAKPAVGNEGEDGYVAPVAASGLTKRVDDLEALMGTESVEDQIDAAIDALAGSATGSDAKANTAGEGEPSNAVPAKVTVKVDSENGEVSAVTVTTSDIASAADLADLTTAVGSDDVADSVKGRISALEALFGDGEGSVSDLIQDAIDGVTGELADADEYKTIKDLNDAVTTLNGDAETDGSVANAVAELSNTAVSATDTAEGSAYDDNTDKPTVTVTLGGTVGAPTVSVEHNIDTITSSDIDALFATKEDSTSDIIGG